MVDALELWEKPQSKEIYMLAGWRQWADAGSVSSGLPEYLAQQSAAKPIGQIHPDGFYLFQIPGTHHLLRPIVRFDQGYPKSLQSFRNEFLYSGNEDRGLVFFMGDEPHLDVERYVAAILEAAVQLNVKRIIGFGGVYGEVPYDKERMVSCTYSLPRLKEQVKALAVSLSDYQGGASIDSFICRRSAEKKIEHVSFYAFVPLYDFSSSTEMANSIRIENDYMAWLGVMQRVNYMLKLGMDFTDLEEKSRRLVHTLDTEIEELIKSAPQLGVREYFEKMHDEFTETPFVPPDDFWEEKLRGLFDDFE
jgi:hypothetical protein